MIVIPLYAALLGILFIALSFRTIAHRRRTRMTVGSGGDEALQRAVRAHGNFAEYVPLAILLLAFLELRAPSLVPIHVLGSLLFIGRVLHAVGVSQVKEDLRFRQVGMVMTFTVLMSAIAGIFLTS